LKLLPGFLFGFLLTVGLKLNVPGNIKDGHIAS
jgi:hypothetical protein